MEEARLRENEIEVGAQQSAEVTAQLRSLSSRYEEEVAEVRLQETGEVTGELRSLKISYARTW